MKDIQRIKSSCIRAGPGLVVMRRDSCCKGRRFEYQYPILDGLFSSWFVVKIVLFVGRKDQNKQRRGRRVFIFNKPNITLFRFTHKINFFKNGPSSFLFIFVFSNKNNNSYEKNCYVHPVYSAGIRNHDLRNTSLLS